MEVGYSRKLKKQYKKLSLEIKEKFNEHLLTFSKNQRSSILNIHKLRGKFTGLYSMNITGDVRAIFDDITPEKIEFIAIGSHNRLYS